MKAVADVPSLSMELLMINWRVFKKDCMPKPDLAQIRANSAREPAPYSGLSSHKWSMQSSINSFISSELCNFCPRR